MYRACRCGVVHGRCRLFVIRQRAKINGVMGGSRYLQERFCRGDSRGQGGNFNLLKDRVGIYIKSKLTTADEVAEAVIEETHDNLTSLSYNGVPVRDNPLFSSSTNDHSAIHRLEEFLRSRTLAELVAYGR